MKIFLFVGFMMSLPFHSSAYGPEYPEWRVVNDTVMGGVSSSSATPLNNGLIRFAGILSLENNGGFASIRSDSDSYELPGAGSLVIEVKGDGRTYTMDLRTGRRRGAFSYKQAFSTKAGDVMEFRLPVRDFRPTAYGRRMPLAGPLNPSEVNSIGFMLADKNPGPFRLDILSIRYEPHQRPEISSPDQLIDRAVSLGVPLFNRGDHDACAAVYETTLYALLLMDDSMVEAPLKREIQNGIDQIAAELSATKQAWALRHLLDDVQRNL